MSFGATSFPHNTGEVLVALICWTPNDGFTVSMHRFDRPRRRYHKLNRSYYDPAPGRVLGFGQLAREPGCWTCVSRSSGLICTNRAGHGWWLGRFRGYRIF